MGGTSDIPSIATAAVTNAAGNVAVAEINAAAQIQAAEIAAGASLIIAALQYKTWQDQIDKQDAIARRIQDRADELHAVWKNSYLPCELATLAEVCSEPIKVADLALVSQRAIAEASKRFSVARKKALYCLPANCVGASCEIETRMAIDQARSEGWQAQAAMRAEEARVDVQNAQRMNNKINMINPGRGGVAVAMNALAGAATIYDRLAQQAAGAFSGAIASAGRFIAQAVNQPSGQIRANNQVGQPTQNYAPVSDNPGILANTNTYGPNSPGMQAVDGTQTALRNPATGNIYDTGDPYNPGTAPISNSPSTGSSYETGDPYNPGLSPIE